MVERSRWFRLAGLILLQSFLPSILYSTPPAPIRLWQFDSGGAISKPVVNGGIIFIASNSGEIYAISEATGRQVWTYNFRADGMTVFGGDPFLYDGVVVVGANQQNCGNGYHGYVYALEQRTGKLRWKLATPGVGTNFVRVDDNIIFGTRRDEWISVQLKTGRINWKFHAPLTDGQCYENSAPDSDSESIVVVAHNRELFGLDRAGHRIWSRVSNAAVSTNPFVYMDVAYFGTTDMHVHGVIPSTGEELADFSVPATPVRGFTWGGANDETVFSFGLIEKEEHKQHLLLAYRDGFERVLWSRDLRGDPGAGTPYYWNNFIVTGNCQGLIAAYSPNDGRPQWNATVKGCVQTIAGGTSTLFVGVKEGTLYSFGYPKEATRP